MAKRQRSGVLNRLAGKRVVFNGKFGYGVEDSLKAMAEAQQGKVCDDLDAKVGYLVLADLNAGKTIQKKATTLNGKGAAIQVIDVDAFKALAEPTRDDIVALIRAGASETLSKLCGSMDYHYYLRPEPPTVTFHSEDLGKPSLSRVGLNFHFQGCRFVGAELNEVFIAAATDCDFSKIKAKDCHFVTAENCRFSKATLENCHFHDNYSGTDFSGATLEDTTFSDDDDHEQPKKAPYLGLSFVKSKLNSASFRELRFKDPDFSGADLSDAYFSDCNIETGTFVGAKLRNISFTGKLVGADFTNADLTGAKLGESGMMSSDIRAGKFTGATLCDASLVGCNLAGADFTKADLSGANLGEADLTGVKLTGANLKNADLYGAKLKGVDLSRAKNFTPEERATPSLHPALIELDAISAKAKRIQVTFRVRSSGKDEGEQIGIDTSGLYYARGVQFPSGVNIEMPIYRKLSFSYAMFKLAKAARNLQVRFETVEVSSNGSPTGRKELHELMVRGIAEAFGQKLPPDEEFAAATKLHRDAKREQGAASRKEAKAKAANQKEKAKKRIAKKIEKTVGKVSDVASFLKALELRIEKSKIDKATKMLKASGFKLFNDVTGEHVSGVVKSQTDPDLVYACRVANDGQYSCCTQNLNVCGGLRGSICKHLLVLIIGLVQAGELDPTTIDGWIAKSHSVNPKLDKENMGAIFIKYKGAEAGEVDWRPTETVPEDYYAL